MKILIFGGGFDPPHRGHAALLAAAIRELKPDRTLVVPTWRSPTKEAHGATAADRLAMTRLFVRDLLEAAVDRFELCRRRKSFAYEILRDARRRWPKAELWFLIGSDSLATLSEWRRPDELRRLGRWLVGRRPGAPLRTPSGFIVRRLKGLFPDIASSELRAGLFSGGPWKASVKPQVARYIERRELYGLDAHKELARTLSPGRYRHTLGVASLAAALARRHGQDPAAAALAGLLHDCGRRFDLAQMARYARAHALPVPDRELTLARSPLLAHAYISADLAHKRFNVQDREVLAAIAQHTLGRPGMAPLERLLYVADIASADRDFPEAARIRRIARRDLDAAFREAVRAKTRYVREQCLWLHPTTARVLRFAEGLCAK